MKIAEASDVVEYLTEDNCSPFGEWFEALDAIASSKIVTAVTRMQNGICRTPSLWEAVFMKTK
jgi:hypothetical protein